MAIPWRGMVQVQVQVQVEVEVVARRERVYSRMVQPVLRTTTSSFCWMGCLPRLSRRSVCGSEACLARASRVGAPPELNSRCGGCVFVTVLAAEFAVVESVLPFPPLSWWQPGARGCRVQERQTAALSCLRSLCVLMYCSTGAAVSESDREQGPDVRFSLSTCWCCCTITPTAAIPNRSGYAHHPS